MKRSLIVLLLLSLSVVGGCSAGWTWNGWGTSENPLTLDQAKMAAYGGAYATALASSAIAAKNGKLSPETAQQIANVIETIQPYAANLSTSKDLYTVLYPVADAQIRKLIPGVNYQDIALLVTSQALRMADRYLENHPEFTEKRTDWTSIVNSILQGAAAGLRDGVGIPRPTTAADPTPKRLSL